MKNTEDYNFFSKLLHRTALGSAWLKETAFDIDCLVNKAHKNPPDISSPVYVTGLARSGTTILLEALHVSGKFSALTYRDMPFVTAPYIWRKYIAKYWRQTKLKERAHDDRLLVNYDSPEAFEEVFWLSFLHGNYVGKTCLKVHGIKEEIAEKYKKYIINIINREGSDKPLRYLSKNNNNLLRIKSLKKIFPKAIIITPFRNPLDQASSLLRQHRHFLKLHAQSKFTLDYMNFLGHFEFGKNFKPFNFYNEVFPKNQNELMDINYWLRYWKYAYEYILKNHSGDVLFFSYDKLCREPGLVFKNLNKALDLNLENTKALSDKIKAPTKYSYSNIDKSLNKQTMDICEKLEENSL